MSEEKFIAVAEFVCQNREKHEKKVKEFCVTTEVCPFEEYLRGYEEESQAIDTLEADLTSPDNTVVPFSIAAFKETLQAFEKYPLNLQKLKKHVAKDINRTLIAGKSQSASDLTIRSQSSADLAIDKLAAAEQWEKGPDVTEIYSNHRKFMKIYKQLQEMSKNDLEQKYVDVMQKIHTLSKDIEKLHGDTLQNAEVAFTTEDANALGRFIDNFEKALNVVENENLFKDLYQNEQSLQNISNVIELLDYCFEKIGYSLEN